MCGIAGYSFGGRSRMGRTLAAQALLAGIAERGADAVGYGYRSGGRLEVHKQQTGASELLDSVVVSDNATQMLVHVRDYTKGHPTIGANNHPVRHGAVTGIHNGIIVNDDELLLRHGIERQEPDMTVDSEAIFALVDSKGTEPSVLEELVGAMAAAWIDERRARGSAPGARHRPPALDRARPTRGAVRVDARRARGHRARSPHDLPQDRGGRGAALDARRRSARRRTSLEP